MNCRINILKLLIIGLFIYFIGNKEKIILHAQDCSSYENKIFATLTEEEKKEEDNKDVLENTEVAEEVIIDTNVLLNKSTDVFGGIEFVWINDAEFNMGKDKGKYLSSDRHPKHKIRISGFWISKYEITQEQYQVIMENNPSRFKGNDNRPVDSVSWDRANEFCKKFSKKYNIKARLPYEAEWECACGAGVDFIYYWGDTFNDQYTWYKENSSYKTHIVGEKKPNKFGLYDMIGNVSEWCIDWYSSSYYQESQIKNPKGPSKGRNKIKRGGSFVNSIKFLETTKREWGKSGIGSQTDGFRVVLGNVKYYEKSQKDNRTAELNIKKEIQAKESYNKAITLYKENRYQEAIDHWNEIPNTSKYHEEAQKNIKLANNKIQADGTQQKKLDYDNANYDLIEVRPPGCFIGKDTYYYKNQLIESDFFRPYPNLGPIIKDSPEAMKEYLNGKSLGCWATGLRYSSYAYLVFATISWNAGTPSGLGIITEIIIDMGIYTGLSIVSMLVDSAGQSHIDKAVVLYNNFVKQKNNSFIRPDNSSSYLTQKKNSHYQSRNYIPIIQIKYY